MSDEKWRKEVAPYITDLYIDAEATLDSEKLKSCISQNAETSYVNCRTAGVPERVDL